MRPYIYISVILFLAVVILLRADPVGMDPYYYLHYAGQPQHVADAPFGMPPLFFYVALIPWQVICVGSLLIFAGLAYLIAKETNNPDPALAMALISVAPMLAFRFAMPEDDIIGILLGFAFIYCCMRLKPFAGKVVPWLYCNYKGLCVCAIIAFVGFFTWKLFPIFMVFPLVSWTTKKFWPIIAIGGAAMLAASQLNTIVGENILGIIAAPITLFGLIIGLKGIKDAPHTLKMMTIYFLCMGAVAAKFLWLCILPLALCLSIALQGMKNKDFAIVFLIGVGLMFGAYYTLGAMPTKLHTSDLKEIANITNGELIANDWTWGHWLRYYGANPTEDNLSPKWVYSTDPAAEWCLTENRLPADLVKNFSWVHLYRC